MQWAGSHEQTGTSGERAHVMLTELRAVTHKRRTHYNMLVDHRGDARLGIAAVKLRTTNAGIPVGLACDFEAPH
jgi:hypothetical protein